jgi:threonine synthase
MKFDSNKKKKEYFRMNCFSCRCAHEIDEYGEFYSCIKCGGLLEISVLPTRLSSFDLHHLDNEDRGFRRGVWRYADLIPVWDVDKVVSISEGMTNLIECKNLEKILCIKSLFVKFEGQNPTGSFKDRGMTVGVSKAVELGYNRVVCASTGNTSASLAAYSSRANIRCLVLIPKGKVALGKVAQAVAYGAQIVQVEGSFDDALLHARRFCESDRKSLLLNSINPFRLEGQKTVAFEIFEDLGKKVPDYVFLPVGNGGNISAAWKGFQELAKIGTHERKLPKMTGVQAEGAAPVVHAFKNGKRDSIDFVATPFTAASAINIGSPVNWPKALAAIFDSDGFAETVSEQEIFEAQSLLASREGIFVEPASAAPIALLAKRRRQDNDYGIMSGSTIVCIATGNGLKDPDAILRGIDPTGFKTIRANGEASMEIQAI